MIDYITIMRKIILFINSAVTNERIDKHVNDAKKHLSNSQTVIYEIYNWAETLYLTVVGMFVIGYLIYTKKLTPIIDMLIAIAIFLFFIRFNGILSKSKTFVTDKGQSITLTSDGDFDFTDTTLVSYDYITGDAVIKLSSGEEKVYNLKKSIDGGI